MSRIRILPEAVVNKIAAGEVVERPASVVKELVENSLDAGASLIKIVVKGGGIKLIRVEDDGEGMERDDLLLAFDRHSTSKIKGFSDLEAISTLGFRGEALPSISAVSEVEITSRLESNLAGTRVHLWGGRIRDVTEVGAPVGTTIEVKRLFFNTPARRKFLKSSRTEMGHIVQVIRDLALANPAVAFRLDKEEETILDVPAVKDIRERVGDIWGRKITDRLIPLGVSEKAMELEGFICPPQLAGTRRKGFSVFVNNRPIRNRMIFSALVEGYGPLLPHNRYPMALLFLGVDKTQMDINVHPTKREVRFSQPALVRQLVVKAVRKALEQARPVRSFFPPGESPVPSRVREGTEVYESPQVEMVMPVLTPEEPAAVPLPSSEFLILGQVKNSYLIVQAPPGLFIIDQHAAHERVLYERFRKALRTEKIEVQPLLSPLSLELGPREAALLSEKIPLLRQLGIEVESFGKDMFIITSLPAILASREREDLILDVIGEIGDWEKEPADPRDGIVIRMACTAAVKARARLAGDELKRLVEELFGCENPSVCPHGRPTILKFTWDELERRFGRK